LLYYLPGDEWYVHSNWICCHLPIKAL
jgi:hypothetical protein